MDGLARIEIANRPTGAPVARVDGAPTDLDISLTDRAGWAVCLVAHREPRVGCDLEIVEPRSAGFVTDFLTVSEQLYLASRPDHDRNAVANLIWSAKESALKVLQTGLRRDTRTVEVTLEERAACPTRARAGLRWRSVPRRASGCLGGGVATASSW